MERYEKHTVASVMSESLEVYASSGGCSSSSLDFVVFVYIESKQEITFVYYLWIDLSFLR